MEWWLRFRQLSKRGAVGFIVGTLLFVGGRAEAPSKQTVEAVRLELERSQEDSLSETVERGEEILRSLWGEKSRQMEYGKLAVELSRAHRFLANYDLAEARAQEAVAVGQEVQDASLEALAHNALGGVYWRRGNYALVWREWLAALKLRETAGDEAGMAATYSNMGILLDEQGDYAGALEYYTRALEIDRKIGSDTLEIAATINNIGTVHEILENYDVALKHYRESLNLRESVGDERGIATSLTNIGSAQREMGNYAEARQALSAALSFRRGTKEMRAIASTLAEMAENELAAGRVEDAYRLGFESWEIRRETAEPWGVAHSALILGDLELSRDRPNEALGWYQLAKESATEIGAQLHLLNERRGVARAHAALGDWAAAYEAQQEFAVIQQEIMGESSRRRIELLEITHETRRREAEISQLTLRNHAAESELERAQWERRMVTFGSLGLAVFIAGLGLAFQMQRKAKRELEVAHSRLERLAEEKDHFMEVVSHDLRSPLGNIRWMAGMMRQQKGVPEEVRSNAVLIDEVAARLVETTTNLLDISRIEEGAMAPMFERVGVSSLVRGMVETFAPVAAQKHQVINVDIEPVGMHLQADASFVTQILENLISNAVKYSPTKGVIEIRGRGAGQNGFISVVDTGPGIAADKQTQLFQKFARIGSVPTAGEDSHGLGLAIARGLAEAMDGSLAYRDATARDGGACFELKLPLSSD